jgi:hypothetical protein
MSLQMFMRTIAQNDMPPPPIMSSFLHLVKKDRSFEFVAQCWIWPSFTANWLLAWRPPGAYRLPQLIPDGWVLSITSGKDTKWLRLTYILNQGTSFPERLQWRSRRIERQLLDFHALHDSVIMTCWGNTSRKNRLIDSSSSRMERPAKPLLSISLPQDDSQVGRQLYATVMQRRLSQRRNWFVCKLFDDIIYVAGKWWIWRFDEIPKVDDQFTKDVKIATLWGDFPKESKWFDQIP